MKQAQPSLKSSPEPVIYRVRFLNSAVVPFPKRREPPVSPKAQELALANAERFLNHPSTEIAELMFETIQTFTAQFKKDPWTGELGEMDRDMERMVYKRKLQALNRAFGDE